VPDKPLVLIVEDDLWIQSIAAELLEDEGFAIATATDGESGLALVETIRPDVILLDLGLPGMSGSRFLEYLHADPSFRETPVIVVSGQAEALSQSVSRLANGVLRKPFDVSELTSRVKDAALGASTSKRKRSRAFWVSKVFGHARQRAMCSTGSFPVRTWHAPCS
jgi:CheY-like chemotaxis protein